MNEGWNVILKHDPTWRGVNLWLVHKRADGTETVVNPVDLTLTQSIQPNIEPPEPTMKFNGSDAHQFLQGLVEGLVEAGFKPDELKASDKELTATKTHLSDMRAIVSSKLNLHW